MSSSSSSATVKPSPPNDLRKITSARGPTRDCSRYLLRAVPVLARPARGHVDGRGIQAVAARGDGAHRGYVHEGLTASGSPAAMAGATAASLRRARRALAQPRLPSAANRKSLTGSRLPGVTLMRLPGGRVLLRARGGVRGSGVPGRLRRRRGLGLRPLRPRHQDLHPAMLRTGEPTGHPSDAFDTVAIIHLTG
jgi:hypothetical protein